ncbi:MAG: DsrE/DsrF/DrsH-like family protein [Candidatus Hydrothermarchaeales archaeon]
MDSKGLAIIFHSGSYDRVYHGLSIALAASALGREVRMFFTYWALEHLKRGRPRSLSLDKEGEDHKSLIENNLEKGHMREIPELLTQAKELGAKLYACVTSMALLNIARDELIDEVDESTGITTFLTETKEYHVLFI